MDFSNNQYAITKKEKDWKRSVIQRTSPRIIEVTVADIEDAKNKMSVAKREAQANAEMQQARVDNILAFNKFISKMSDEKVHAVWLYYEALKKKKEYEATRDELVEKLDNYQTELEHIIKTVGPVDSDAWISNE